MEWLGFFIANQTGHNGASRYMTPKNENNSEMLKCKSHLSGNAARPLEARRSPSIGLARIIWFACWLPGNIPCWKLFTKLSCPFTKLVCWLLTKWLFWVGFCISCFWQNVSASTLRFAFARRFWNQILIWNGKTFLLNIYGLLKSWYWWR